MFPAGCRYRLKPYIALRGGLPGLSSLGHDGKRSRFCNAWICCRTTGQHNNAALKRRSLCKIRSGMGRCQSTERTEGKICSAALSGHILSISTFLSGGEARLPSSESLLKDLSVQLPVRVRCHRLPELNNKSGLSPEGQTAFVAIYGTGNGMKGRVAFYSRRLCRAPVQAYLLGNSSRAFSAKRRPKISKSALHPS